MATRLQDGEKILFIGDSITDCGRRSPEHRPIGCGYVSYFRDFLAVREPEKSVKVVNTGIGGDNIENLRSRWADDMLAHEPDWLSIKIGVNDCNQWLTDPSRTLQSPEKYEAIYDQLLGDTLHLMPNLKVLLIDPFFASHDRPGKVAGAYRGRVWEALQRYLAACERMGEKYGTYRVHTHRLFWEHFEKQSPSVCFPNEPVHPNQTGHIFIAEAVYRALSV